jgi:hypothetical protein
MGWCWPGGNFYYRSAIGPFSYSENTAPILGSARQKLYGNFLSKERHAERSCASKGKKSMISGGRTSIHAAECADRAGKHAFGLNDTKAIAALRKLADDIEAGTVVLNSVTTSSHATHEEFAIREVVIEVLEDYPSVGPRMVRE